MIPVIAIVGRPNVGKSTLFNRLTKSRDAIVADIPGVTRDRQYGHASINDKPYVLIDTGGIGEESENIDESMTDQSIQAMQEADQVIFLVDGRTGVSAADEQVAQQIRQLHIPVHLVVNKTDGVDTDVAAADFYQLGLSEPMCIAASHGRGVTAMIEHVLADYLDEQAQVEQQQDLGIKIAFIGKPNVGKSTLVNRILGEERVIVYDLPGTTRDSIFVPFERRDQKYTLIDTAGIRRKARVNEVLEKFSVIKSLRAIEEANVAILVIDAKEGLTDQDLRILGYILDAGRAVVIAFNKWDGMSTEDKQAVKNEIDRRLGYVDYITLHFISALHGTGVGDLFKSIIKAYASATKELHSSQLTKILEQALEAYQPPLVRGRRIKLRYAHPGGVNPPKIIIHGNQTDAITEQYTRYLTNSFRKALKIVGTPIKLVFKTGSNPFAGRRNKLTPNQQRKRKRMMRHVKKS